MRKPSSSSSSASAAAEGSKNKKKSSSGTSTTPTPCCIKVGLKRGPWTPEEDEVLADYIRKEGEGRWRTLPKRAGLLRCGKSCRLRWMNYLRPCVKRGQIAPDEEDLILRLHRLLGNRWSLIAGRIPGRTDNEIKNYWNTHLSKKLISQGIDPRTHKPLNPSIPSSSTTPPSNHNPVSSKSVVNNNPKPNNPLPQIITNHQTPSTHHPIHDAIPNPDHLIIVNQENAYFDPKSTTDDHLDQYQEAQVAGIVTNNGYHADNDNLNPTAPTDSDVFVMGLIRSSNLLTTNNEDDDDINYCSDDVFSSFLNSLINEDAFATQHHLQPEPPNGHSIAPHSDHDPLISIAAASVPPAYGSGVGWESPLMSATLSQNDPKRVDDHDE